MKKHLSLTCLLLSAFVFAGCRQSQSTDFYVFELSGHVKSVTTYTTARVSSNGKKNKNSFSLERETINFDEHGVLSSYEDGNTQASIERDKQGNIISIDIPCEREDGSFSDWGYSITYTWGENGLPISEEYSNCVGGYYNKTFTYNDSIIVGTVQHNCDEGESWDLTRTYKILSTDTNGNWTKRLITENSSENSHVEFSLEERIITYYDDAENGLRVKKPKTIEEEIYSLHGDYAVFKGDYTFNGKQIWAIFLRDEEMIVFINSNNIHKSIELALRYEYEIRDNKLRFYNGYESASVLVDKHYPETSAKIYLDDTGVSFYNMKQYGNRKNVNISATLTDEYLPDDFLNYVKKFAHY